MRRSAVRPTFLAMLVLLAVPALGCAAGAPEGTSGGFRATVAYAVDGDTLRIREADGGLAYVRLVGIDTPEDVRPGSPVECGSREAARSMDHLAPEGAGVRRIASLGATVELAGQDIEDARIRPGKSSACGCRPRRACGIHAPAGAARVSSLHATLRCSSSRSRFSPGSGESISANASSTLSRASSRLRPWLSAPGTAGIEATIQPSSPSS